MNLLNPGWAAIIAFVVIIGVLVGTASLAHSAFGSWTERGQFGDTFGLANAIFSGLAFAGVVYAIRQQQQEIRIQREDLTETRQLMRVQYDAQVRPAFGFGDFRTMTTSVGNDPPTFELRRTMHVDLHRRPVHNLGIKTLEGRTGNAFIVGAFLYVAPETRFVLNLPGGFETEPLTEISFEFTFMDDGGEQRTMGYKYYPMERNKVVFSHMFREPKS